MKGKTRIKEVQYTPWGESLYLVQLWASKRWITLHVASSNERAAKWLELAQAGTLDKPA